MLDHLGSNLLGLPQIARMWDHHYRVPIVDRGKRGVELAQLFPYFPETSRMGYMHAQLVLHTNPQEEEH